MRERWLSKHQVNREWRSKAPADRVSYPERQYRSARRCGACGATAVAETGPDACAPSMPGARSARRRWFAHRHPLRTLAICRARSGLLRPHLLPRQKAECRQSLRAVRLGGKRHRAVRGSTGLQGIRLEVGGRSGDIAQGGQRNRPRNGAGNWARRWPRVLRWGSFEWASIRAAARTRKIRFAGFDWLTYPEVTAGVVRRPGGSLRYPVRRKKNGNNLDSGCQRQPCETLREPGPQQGSQAGEGTGPSRESPKNAEAGYRQDPEPAAATVPTNRHPSQRNRPREVLPIRLPRSYTRDAAAMNSNEPSWWPRRHSWACSAPTLTDRPHSW